jgi:hypothetical protein
VRICCVSKQIYRRIIFSFIVAWNKFFTLAYRTYLRVIWLSFQTAKSKILVLFTFVQLNTLQKFVSCHLFHGNFVSIFGTNAGFGRHKVSFALFHFLFFDFMVQNVAVPIPFHQLLMLFPEFFLLFDLFRFFIIIRVFENASDFFLHVVTFFKAFRNGYSFEIFPRKFNLWSYREIFACRFIAWAKNII